MKPLNHVIVSTGLSASLMLLLKSWPAAAACFVSGILIDLDHHWDYFLVKKKFPWRYRDIARYCDYDDGLRVYLFFHAHEYLIAVWAAIYAFRLDGMILGAAVGVTVHVLLDQFTNPVKPLFYFLSYRIKYDFDKTKLMAPEYFNRFPRTP